jgi:hypothetical protein
MVDEIFYFTEDSLPYDETYGHWTVRWWQWFLSTPRSINPVVDRNGEYDYVNQPFDDVCFLVGKLADEDGNLPDRFCRIPTGRSILFPVINCEANQLECPELRTYKDIVERVERDQDTIIRKDCFVNGKRISPQRVKSDPSIFELKIDKENVFDVKGGESTSASADGYWVFLKPLPLGKHVISFQGSCEFGKLNAGAIYHLEVRDKPSASKDNY